MKRLLILRRIGYLLFAGVVIFTAATIICEPFKQDSLSGLYQEIALNTALYRGVNLISTVGILLILTGLVALAWQIRKASDWMFPTTTALLAISGAFWLAEVIARLTVTTAYARAIVETGNLLAPPHFHLGVGFDPLIINSLIWAVCGVALIVWGLSRVCFLPGNIAAAGPAAVVLGGILPAFFYPWIGAVERAMIYPLALVVLPLALLLIFQKRRKLAVIQDY